MASASCSSVCLSANQRDVFLLLLLSLGVLSSQAQSTLPCMTTPLPSDVFARCMNISLATLKSDPTTLFGQDVSQHTLIVISGTSDTVLHSNTFASFPQLTELTIWSESLSVIQPGAFSGMPHLTYLGLLSTRLSVLSIAAFDSLQAMPSSLTLELRNDRDIPLMLNRNLGPFFKSLMDLQLEATVVCDCHILWLIEVLLEFQSHPSSFLTCYSANPMLDGQDVRNANATILNDTCPDICSTELNECDKSHGNCTALTEGSLQCSCLPGFDGNGYFCEDIDECSMNNSCPQEHCSNTIGSFTCGLCAMEETWMNESCVCREGLLRNSTTGDCICSVAGMVFDIDSRTCLCEDSLSLYDNTANACRCSFGSINGNVPGSCVCPQNKTEIGGRCNCPEDFVEGDAGMCVCPQNKTEVDGSCLCPGDLVEDDAGMCVCPQNKTEIDGICFCPEDLVEDDAGMCVCPQNKTEVDGSCLCPGDLVEDDAGMCVCPQNKTEVDGSCICHGDLFEDQSGLCVCPHNKMDVNSECVCVGGMVEDNSSLCVCPGNKTEVNGSCICPGDLVEDQSDLCICPVGQEYLADLGRCQCTQIHQQFDVSIGHCVCSPPYISNKETGTCECRGSEDCPSALDQLLMELTSQEPSLMTIQNISEMAQDQVQEGIGPEAIATLVSIISTSSDELEHFSSDQGLLEAAESIVNLTSHLLTDEVVDTWISAGNISSNVQALLMAIETVAEALVVVANQTESGIVTILTDNILLRVAIPKKNSSEWQSFSTAALTGDPVTASNVLLPPSIVEYASCDAAIVSSAFQGVHRLLVASLDNTVTAGVDADAANQNILSGLCPARDIRMPSQLNSAILSTSIVADCYVNTSSINDSVIISLYHENSELVSPVCVSDGGLSGTGGLLLNSAGCMVVSSTATRTECACSHLTSFAILMYPSTITATFYSLNNASKAGLCVSILCLFLTVIILWVVKVKSDLPKVHRQLALSLLLTDITFLIGVDRQAVPSPDGLCTTFAAVLHYFLLVTFTWMLIEGVHIFIMIVIVFFSKKVYIVYYFIGWGLPLIIVGITLGVRFCDYGSTAFCWISTETTVWGAVLGPIILVLLVNIVILAVVTVVVIRAKRKQDKNANIAIVPLRTAIVLYPVLGLSWISGFLIFGDDPTYIQAVEWIFFVFVTLQGVVIFVMNCIVNKEVRQALLKKLGCRKASLSAPPYTLRRSSTVASLKNSWRRMSVGSTRRKSEDACSDITEMTLKESTSSYTVARPVTMGVQSPLSDVIVEEEEEMSTSNVEREPQRVDPATGMLEVHCNMEADHDE